MQQSKYSTTEKECVAKVGRPQTTVRCFHPLFEPCSAAVAPQHEVCQHAGPWYLALQSFKFTVVHRPGAQMVGADILSCQWGGLLQAGWLPGLHRAVGLCSNWGYDLKWDFSGWEMLLANRGDKASCKNLKSSHNAMERKTFISICVLGYWEPVNVSHKSTDVNQSFSGRGHQGHSDTYQGSEGMTLLSV